MVLSIENDRSARVKKHLDDMVKTNDKYRYIYFHFLETNRTS
jgi:hypothetical protein